MKKLLMDIEFLGYVFLASVCLYGVILFSWWWKKMETASEVYIYITFLYFFTFCLMLTSVYGEYYWVLDREKYFRFEKSFYWSIRIYPVLFILLAIVIRMTQRVILTIRKIKHFKIERKK